MWHASKNEMERTNERKRKGTKPPAQPPSLEEMSAPHLTGTLGHWTDRSFCCGSNKQSKNRSKDVPASCVLRENVQTMREITPGTHTHTQFHFCKHREKRACLFASAASLLPPLLLLLPRFFPPFLCSLAPRA